MLIVSFRYSKTIQFRERTLHTPLIEIQDSLLCPVKAFQHMCSSTLIKPEDPLFSLPNKECVWYNHFQTKLKHLIKKTGLKPDNFSSHSFRRCGTSYKKYLALTLHDKICVAETMKKCILTGKY